MHLAIEYLMRKGIVRDWFDIPCSLFITEAFFAKKVVTISEEFKPSSFYCVKHWHVYSCKRTQAIPSFTEFQVPKTEVFTNQAVVVPGHRLMKYHVSPIPFNENGTSHPMMNEIYQFFYDHYVDSYKHREQKLNWLWSEFVRTYMPQLSLQIGYVPSYKSEEEMASDQRKFVATTHTDLWQCWAKWCRYMLLLEDGRVPGELVFMGEYYRQKNDAITSFCSSS